MARNYRKYTDDQVEDAIKNSYSWRETAFKVGLNGNAGSNYTTLRKIAKKYKFDFSHFKGQGWNLGGDAVNAIPLSDLLKKESLARSDTLKKKLIKKGILKNVCSECGQLPIWNNRPLVLELDHIDGDSTNNILSNLRILCIHCHSQTFSFRGRKNKRVKTKNVIKKIKNYHCSKCNKEITKFSKTGLCKSCFNKTRSYENANRKVKNRPPKEQLSLEIKELGYCGTGRKYGVSDNCIRKWLK